MLQHTVQQQNLGVAEDGSGDGNPLLLAAGELHSPLSDLRVVSLRRGHDEVVGKRRLRGGDDVVEGGVGVGVANVFADGASKEPLRRKEKREREKRKKS